MTEMTSWYPIASREQSTMADTWSEYLCATPDGSGWLLGICVYELLGYIPSEWFDEDGEPLPEFRDEDGSFIPPAEYEGDVVVGHDGEYLLGPLGQWNDDTTAQLPDLSKAALEEALKILDWTPNDAPEILAALMLLGEVAGDH